MRLAADSIIYEYDMMGCVAQLCTVEHSELSARRPDRKLLQQSSHWFTGQTDVRFSIVKKQMHFNDVSADVYRPNPLTPTVAIWTTL